MLNVQTYLLTHSLDELALEHGVYARFSTKNPAKFSLNYDQLEAKDADVISQECRGLVLSSGTALASKAVVVGPTQVLAYPMHRFFNYGQGAVAPVDFEHPDTKFYEKLDGTLCMLYFDPSSPEWCVATRSVPDADLPMDGFGALTFSDLFWKAFHESGGNVSVLAQNTGKTFCFELCTPDNQIVVRYDDYKVFLLAVRDNLGKNLAVEDFGGLCVPLAPSYRLGSVSDMLNFVSSREPSKFEGIVACDHNFNRCKVKNAGYMALGKIKDSVAKSPRAVMEIVLLGQEDDVMPLCQPPIQKMILNYKEKIVELFHAWDALYTQIYDPDRKTFALAVDAAGANMGYMMTRWQGRCSSAHDWVTKARKGTTWGDGFLDNLISLCK